MIKPILFNAEMVQAILRGQKTCTRRLVKHDVNAILNSPYHKEHPEVADEQIIEKLCQPPYHTDDILYVRETWGEGYEEGTYIYKADDKLANLPEFKETTKILYHPSIHMPRGAARIWLKVTDVRVERLQDITDAEAEKEGCNDYTSTALGSCYLWDSTIKKSDIDRYGWNANPWVWVIEFERCEKPKEGEWDV